MSKLELGKDYYIEDGKVEFTRDYLWQREYCCNNGCKNCPYLKDQSITLQIINSKKDK